MEGNVLAPLEPKYYRTLKTRMTVTKVSFAHGREALVTLRFALVQDSDAFP